MSTFRVATFFDQRSTDTKPLLSRVSAYTIWYSPTWPGCIVYEVEAESGTAAKRIARERRLEEEKARVKR